MSTLRSIERRLYVRRQVDRDMSAQAVVATGEAPRHMEWNGIWTGYMTFAGAALILLSFVFAMGFSSVNPFSAASWRSVGGGVLGWSVVVVLIATWLGCWVAARTPRTTRRHGMMRGITLWAMILLTIVLVAGWVATTTVSAVAPATTAAMTAPGAAATARAAATPAQKGALTTSAQNAGAATTQVAGQMMWGFFLIALIGLGLALFAGAMGGGGINLRRGPHTTNPPTTAA